MFCGADNSLCTVERRVQFVGNIFWGLVSSPFWWKTSQDGKYPISSPGSQFAMHGTFVQINFRDKFLLPAAVCLAPPWLDFVTKLLWPDRILVIRQMAITVK